MRATFGIPKNPHERRSDITGVNLNQLRLAREDRRVQQKCRRREVEEPSLHVRFPFLLADNSHWHQHSIAEHSRDSQRIADRHRLGCKSQPTQACEGGVTVAGFFFNAPTKTTRLKILFTRSTAGGLCGRCELDGRPLQSVSVMQNAFTIQPEQASVHCSRFTFRSGSSGGRSAWPPPGLRSRLRSFFPPGTWAKRTP